MHNFPTSIFPSFTSHIFSPCSTRRLLNLAGNFGFSSKTVNFEGCFFKSLNGCFVSRHNPRAKLHRLKWTSLKKKPRTIFTFLSRWFCLRRRKTTLCNSWCEVYLNCLYKRASLKACSLRMENEYNFLPIFLKESLNLKWKKILHLRSRPSHAFMSILLTAQCNATPSKKHPHQKAQFVTKWKRVGPPWRNNT